jgi:agmatinase
MSDGATPGPKRDVRQRDALRSPRFAQPATYARLPLADDLADVDAAFLGIPFDDATTFRSGARMGPAGVREHSRLLRPYNLFVDVSPFDVLNVVDFGDVDVVPGYIFDTFERIEATLDRLCRERVAPFICGGDHSITLPVLRSLARAHGPVHLIHFDSHLDFWDAYWGKKYTHGTWLRRAVEENLVGSVAQAGIRGSQYAPNDLDFAHEHAIRVETIDAFFERGARAVMADILAGIPADGPLYISWDIDVVDPAFAGATGTPEVGGLGAWDAVQCVRALVGHRLVGMDVVEVAPPYDGPGGQTSLLAANLLYEAISVLARNVRVGLGAFAAGAPKGGSG